MYRFKTYESKDSPWIEDEEEIRALAEDVNKAIDIVVKGWRGYCPFWIYPIDVSGGVHERDTGYEEFSGGRYAFDLDDKGAWVDKLVEDFNAEKAKLKGTWFSNLTFDRIDVIIMGCYGPVVLTFQRRQVEVTVCYDEEYKYREKAMLSEFERVFGSA